MNELVFRAVNAIEEGLSAIPPEALGFKCDANLSDGARQEALEEMKQTELGSGCVQLESLLNATVDRDFDKFEIYTLRNILALGHEDEAKDLANWVQLEHYRHLDVSAGERAPSPEDVQLQRRKLHETQKLNAMLKAEEAKNTAMLEQLRALMGTKSESGAEANSPFACLTAPRAGGSQPVAQDVQFALAQLPALRNLLAQLKDSLHSLPNARHAPRDESSREAKRRQYLDSQARRVIQNRGVDTDSAGRHDNVGRKIGQEEVEGIEAVVQALAGAPASGERAAQ